MSRASQAWPRRQAGRARDRRGNALIMFVLLAVVIMAIGGLVIDVGTVLLARRQMQAAVNTAALEALRNGPQAASSLVEEKVFADQSGQNIPYGAGSYIPYQSGIPIEGTNYLASQLIPPPAAGNAAQPNGSPYSGPWLPPALDPNSTNEQAGDIVAGNYLGDSQGHVEDDSYGRVDFDPAASTPDSALVRMRRSMEYPNSSFPSGATGGPPVPSLFSRGDPLLLNGGNPVLANGFTVRATAIAQWKPAVSVRIPNPGFVPSPGQIAGVGVGFADPRASGLSQDSPPQLPYVVPLQWQSAAGQSQWLAITDQLWMAASWSPPVPSVNGVSESTAAVPSPATIFAISTLGPPSTASPNSPSFPVAIGQTVTPTGVAPPTAPVTGLVPIVSMQNSSWIIVGFAYANFASSTSTLTRYLSTNSLPPNYTSQTTGQATPPPVQITRAVQNASTSLSAVTGAEMQGLSQSLNVPAAMTARAALITPDPLTGIASAGASYLLSAPALVRSTQ